ncbi:hypothetical protein M430DRAFT_42570 [Amorphotheca resinae ATCC 22711]|uniref:Uncharacterized protein n=1 Tax=Amorphotheca resinae ATCC 22711 TaxID=857342 RepID=A0A2T3AZH4_AMORE|nr:hypothetical protein M430DRAFT_42570 [Amorphotheca resinae ATCC 22711]PSS16558.1 hypothetical protein M430DRAFT_42570 [Amorphotheca resinae ATCC 22711]
MEITDPSLGMFSLLPAEIRTEIWKHFSPQLHVGRSLPRKPNHLSRDQEILLTSRKIYAEVAAEVPSGYNDNTIIISVSPEYRYKSWIKAKNTKGVQWDLEDLLDAISRGFCDLPWHNLNVQIWIWAPHRKDSAQILCLYKKVRALVEILKGAKGCLSLWVVFGHTKNTSWFDNAQPQCSIKIEADLLALLPWTRAKWDYEFIFPLFLQIRNVKMARMYSTEMFEGKQENRMMGETFMKAQRIMRKTTPYGSGAADWYDGKRIEEYLNHLFMMVERKLDLLPSKTANMLRLDRFSSWYTDKLHGNSPYENELKKLLLDGVEGHDTLRTMNDRYRIMRAHNPLSLAYRSAFPKTFDSTKHPDIDARGWNRDAWHCVYRRGIPPLNGKKTKERYRKWSMEYDAPENGREFVKLHSYFSLLIGTSIGRLW